MKSMSVSATRQEHWPLCSFLSVASELLACGMDDLLEEGMARISPPPATVSTPDSSNINNVKNCPNIFADYSSIEADETTQFAPLLRLSIVILISQMPNIRRSLQRLNSLAYSSSRNSNNSILDFNLSSLFRHSSFSAMQYSSTLPPLSSSGLPLPRSQTSCNTSSSNSQSNNKHGYPCWRYVEIDRDGQRGRFVRSQQALGPGITVCTDRPYMLSLASPCQCRYHSHSNPNNDREMTKEEMVMPLLVEHVALATCLYHHLTNNSKTTTNNSLSNKDSQLSPVLYSHAKVFFTLLDGHLPTVAQTTLDHNQQTAETTPSDTLQIPWSPQQLRIFAIVSALMVLLEEEEHAKESEDSSLNSIDSSQRQTLNDELDDIRTQWRLVDASFKSRMTTKALLFFRILVRLPTNTHAVSMLQQSGGLRDTHHTPTVSPSIPVTVQSKTIAYAVFLQASAINHSCEANTTIRYSMSDDTNVHTVSPETLLTSLQVDILTTKDNIPHNAEITCCYGPLYPRHPLRLRQDTLQKQYLFHCRCVACTRETHQLMSVKAQQYIANNQDVSLQRKQRQQQLFQDLQQLSEDALEINVAWTTLMTQPGHLQSESNPSVISLLTEHLQHLCRVSRLPDTSTSNRPETQQNRVNSLSETHSNEKALTQLWHVLQYLETTVMRDTILIGAFGPQIYQELCSLHCDTDDKAAAERFRSLSFRSHNFFQDTTRDTATEDTPLFLPHSVMWKECLSVWCLLLDIQAQMLSSLPPHLRPLLPLHHTTTTTTRDTPTTMPRHMWHAAQCVNFAINLMIGGALYEAQDIVIARERVKAASLYLAAGDWQRSRRRATLALTVLQLHCGDTVPVDPDLQEARHIVRLTEDTPASSAVSRKGREHRAKNK